jgi:hypothetical protein
MKSLEINFVGPVRRPGPERTLFVDPSQLETVTELLSHLGYDEREMAMLHLLSDGERLRPESSLEGVTKVEILIAIGGG